MLISARICYALATSVALTALAGCGGSQMTPASLGGSASRQGVTRPSFMDRRAVGKPLAFLSDSGSTVDIYLQTGKNKMVGQITGFYSADDLATDFSGDLFVLDFSSGVTVYAPPYDNGPKLALHPGRYPTGVAVSRQGTVAVTTCTILSGSQCGQGVIFYAANSATPCATVLVDASVFTGNLLYAGFDRKGNLYVDGTNSTTKAAVFARIDGGCNAKRARTLTISNTIAGPGGIKVDKAGRIAILDGSNQNAAVIDVYDPPKGSSLGNPVSTTSLTVTGYAGPFTFGASGRTLWAAYQSSGPYYGSEISEYPYPAGGVPERSVIGTPNSYPGGVAVTPPLVP